MKTKAFLLVCLFLGIGLTQLSAQNGKNGTGTISYWIPEFDYYIPVYSSGGDLIDMLAGTVQVHVVLHIKNGVYIKAPQQMSGEVVSVGCENENGDWVGGTGETFKIKDEFQVDLTTFPIIGNGHYNAIGSLGSHYIIFYSYANDGVTENFDLVKALSPGSK